MGEGEGRVGEEWRGGVGSGVKPESSFLLLLGIVSQGVTCRG